MTNVVQFPRTYHSAWQAPFDGSAPAPDSLLGTTAQLRADAANVRDNMTALSQAVADLKALDLAGRARQIVDAAIKWDAPAVGRSGGQR